MSRSAALRQPSARVVTSRAALPGRPKVLVYPRNLTARFDPANAGLMRVHDGAVADLYAFPGAVTGGPS